MDTAQPIIPEPESSGPVSAVHAMGFPSPARDYYDAGLDLNRLLITDRVSSFIMRVQGDSMRSAGIYDGDEIIVDRSRTPRHGNVVVLRHNDQLLIRRWMSQDGRSGLLSDEMTETTWLDEADDVEIFGLVTRCLHYVR